MGTKLTISFSKELDSNERSQALSRIEHGLAIFSGFTTSVSDGAPLPPPPAAPKPAPAPKAKKTAKKTAKKKTSKKS